MSETEQRERYHAFHDQSSHPDAFPQLSAEQIERLGKYGEPHTYADGDVLLEQGDHTYCFFVVKSGGLRIVRRGAQGEADQDFAYHSPGEFTGEVGMIRRQSAVATIIADGEAEVLCLAQEALQQVMAQESDIGEIILRASILRRMILREAGYANVRLIGSRWSSRTFELKDMLARHGVFFEWTDPDQCNETESMLCELKFKPKELPVIIGQPFGILKNPTNDEAAEALGLRRQLETTTYDLVIVGAGPGGLAAAVYGASEGLTTLVLDGEAPGGQAGLSSKIENFLGFPLGLSGEELANRAVTQAQKFGAVISSPNKVESLACGGRGYYKLKLSSGEEVHARSLVVATGACYRRLPNAGCEPFEGTGVYYGATRMEANLCKDADVIVIGGGNSAGQAAVFLSQHAKSVKVVIRGESLSATMSRYLIDRIENSGNIELRRSTEVKNVEGNGRLTGVTLKTKEGQEEHLPVNAVFVMIGADPATNWLSGCVGLDKHGFVVTGADAAAHRDFQEHWHGGRRQPFYLETTRAGIFAVGDVRANSVKRVASAVGEGSMAIKYVHEVLSR